MKKYIMLCTTILLAIIVIFLTNEMIVSAQTGKEDIPINPVHYCDTVDNFKDTTTWSYVYFGSYPQSEITDSVTINAIEEALKTSYIKGSSGVDIWVNGTKYRRIVKNDTNYSGNFGNDSYRYFKWERIKWRVLRNDGRTLFLMADTTLDCKNYHNNTGEAVWENCFIRDWLNEDFYNTAFCSKEKEAIVRQNVINEDNPYHGTKAGNNTTDKVYLLSVEDAINQDYGFCSDYSTYSQSRRLQPSKYASAMGASPLGNSGYVNDCDWWLRSPGCSNDRAVSVFAGGRVYEEGVDLMCVDNGVSPVLHVSLSSNVWSISNDGTSGEGGSINTVIPIQQNKDNDDELPSENKDTVKKESNQQENITKTPAKKGTKLTDKTYSAKFTVTSADSKNPTVAYTGTTNKKKKSITIPQYITYQGVQYKVTSISAKALKGNKKVTSVKIASSITKIGTSAFEGCTNLKTVTIGTGLKTIGKSAFKNCKKLKTLKIKSSKLKSVGKNAFKGIYKKCKIKVPSKKVKAYKKLMKNKGQKSTVKITK